jgi:hypothetical protein
MMIEGSTKDPDPALDPDPDLTSGSGSGRPKNTWIRNTVPDDVQQLLPDGVDGEVFPLLLERLGERELGLAALLVHLHVVQEAGVLAEVRVVLLVLRLGVIHLWIFCIKTSKGEN